MTVMDWCIWMPLGVLLWLFAVSCAAALAVLVAALVLYGIERARGKAKGKL